MTLEAITLSLRDAEATRCLGRDLGLSLPALSVLLLQGDLGAGKTTLVQGLAEGLGIAEPVVSPTFTLIDEYSEGRFPLYHLDLYRLEPAQVAALHPELYWEGIEVPAGIVAIEWADRLPYLPPSYLQIRLIYQENSGRQAELVPVGSFHYNIELAISD